MVGLLVTLLLAQTHPTRLSDEDLNGAVALWKEFSMPIPPATVQPIFLRTYYPVHRTIALLDQRAGKPDLFYVGGSIIDSKEDNEIEELSWDFRSKEPLELQPFGTKFTEDSNISAIVQSQILGRTDFAKALVERSGIDISARRSGLDTDWIGVPNDNSLKTRCAMLIATHLVNDYCKPNSNVKAILAQLERLDKYGLISFSRRMRTRTTLTSLIPELQDLVSPPQSIPGSVQEAVDNLANMSSESGIRAQWGAMNPRSTREYKRVLSFGLEAVIPLANELDNHRLTRLFNPRFDDARPMIVPVEWIAHGLLVEIAKGDLGKGFGLDRQTALGWYEAKRKNKVEDWMLANLTKSYTFTDGQRTLVANTLVLDAIYVSHHDLLKTAISNLKKMPVPIPQEYEFLEPLPEDTNDVREVYAILAKLQSEKPLAPFNRLLAKFLEKSPVTFDESYAALTPFALETENHQVWSNLAAALKRADTTMRICLLSRLMTSTGVYDPPFFAKIILPIFREYFDDTSKIKDFSQKEALSHFGILPGANTPSVGRVALHRAALICLVLTHDDKDLSEEDWKLVRKKIDTGDYRPLRHHKDD